MPKQMNPQRCSVQPTSAVSTRSYWIGLRNWDVVQKRKSNSTRKLVTIQDEV